MSHYCLLILSILIISVSGFIPVSKFSHNKLSLSLNLNEMVENDRVIDGSITFYQLEKSPGKPPLLFIPGLDGTGNYSGDAITNLTNTFDVWRVLIPPDDRSRFVDVAMKVSKFMSLLNQSTVLMGESFGGLLAAYVSVISKSKPSRLVLINPATSYDRTAWNLIAPFITNSGDAFPVVGLATLLATAIEFDQFQRIGRTIIDRINSTETAIIELNAMFESSKMITERLPPATLEWRLTQWLSTGSFLMTNKYSEIKTPTLIIVGQNDRLLPSRTEGRRLSDVINNTKVELYEFKDSGHALLDGSFDFADVLLHSKTIKSYLNTLTEQSSISSTYSESSTISSKIPSKLDISFPTPEEIDAVEKQFNTLFTSLSPIFLTRDSSTHPGRTYVTRGIEHVPIASEVGRPVLFVGNHQLYGADLGLLLREFIRQRKTLIRGLAHPLIFQESPQSRRIVDRKILAATGSPKEAMMTSSSSSSSFRRNRTRSQSQSASTIENTNTTSTTVARKDDDDEEDFRNLFIKFGAVEVNPGNYLELLKRKETILLFPGGVKEAYHRKGEEYKLLWPEKMDFIRMAALYDAIIVPFGAVGMADSVNMVLDRDDILNIPILRKNALETSRKIPQARAGGDDQFIAPISVPGLPSRNYFVFEEPYDTRNLNVNNKKECRQAYDEVRHRVENGIDFLLSFRENDPYKDFIPRILYETTRRQQAPTAPLNK